MATSEPESARQPLPSRNPIPLSAAQEQAVKQLYHQRVRSYCADDIREFAECASGRTFTATWVCRQQKIAMNSCMLAHAGQQEEDKAREEFFATAMHRRTERQEKERNKAEQEKFHREWWDADERERARRRE